jgi:hypothetical protein
MLLATMILGVSASRGLAQTEAVDLRLHYKAGETILYSLSRVYALSVQVGDERRTSTMTFDAREAHRVMDLGADGVILVEMASEDIHAAVDGRACGCGEAPLMMRVRPDGTVSEVLAGEKQTVYPFKLPERAVAAGDAWTERISDNSDGGTYLRTTTFTLASVQRDGDHRVAVIRVTIDGTMSSSTMRGTIRGRGEIQWSVDEGRTLRSNEEWTLETQGVITIAGNAVRVATVIRSTERREPLSGVTPVSTDADLLIVPGKSIGASTLGMTVADLTARYGEPSKSQTEGIRAAKLNWRSLPSAYVDASDNGKLLGLTISDPRFRTDRGIGFGSSEGAVLFAYGMSPSRVEFSIPGVGGVRLLIYNDLGIAFAITADQQHAQRGDSHAPVGAVDWITVFPPGTAANIYTLP